MCIMRRGDNFDWYACFELKRGVGSIRGGVWTRSETLGAVCGVTSGYGRGWEVEEA